MSSGRLNGIEIARCEWYREGRVPLHTPEGRHRLRLLGSQDDLRRDRREGVGLPWRPPRPGRSARKPEADAGRPPSAPWSAPRRAGGCDDRGRGRGPVPIARRARPVRRPTAATNLAVAADAPKTPPSSARKVAAPGEGKENKAMLQPNRRKYRKGAEGPQHRHRHARCRSVVRRLRPEGHRARPPDGAPDRGRPSCHLAPHQARRPHLHPHLPDKPISQKPAEVRMGNGKGNLEYWVAEIQPARCCTRSTACPRRWPARPFTLASAKLPLKCTFALARSAPEEQDHESI